MNFGPIWDYDWSLYTPWTDKPNEYYELSDEMKFSNQFFKTMVAIPELYEIVKEHYWLYARPSLCDYIAGYDYLVDSMEQSIDINNTKWYEAKDISRKNVDFLKDFLIHRRQVLDYAWGDFQ